MGSKFEIYFFQPHFFCNFESRSSFHFAVPDPDLSVLKDCWIMGKEIPKDSVIHTSVLDYGS